MFDRIEEKKESLFDKIFITLLQRDNRRPQNLEEYEVIELCEKAESIFHIINGYKILKEQDRIEL